MTRRRWRAAGTEALAIAIFLPAITGCAGFTAASAGIAAATSIYGLARNVGTSVSSAIDVACREWLVEKGRSQIKVRTAALSTAALSDILSLTAYADAACDPKNPPPGDPLATAVWLGGIIARVALESGDTPP